MRGKRLVSNVDRLASEITSRAETLAAFCDLTPAQRKRIGPPHRIATLDELFEYYQWALEKRTLDPVTTSALAIICEKFLGLTRWDAMLAMRQAKRAEDYKHLLPSKNRSA
jgi:hypothetical protein